jgi:hypothetical protein
MIFNYPTVRPKLFLDFVRSNRLDPRVTFTRASSATRVGPDGRIQVMGNDAPRFDYDPVSGACRGLLIEGTATNMVDRSQDFTSGVWTTTNMTVVSNTGVDDPSGGTSAGTLQATAGNAVFQNTESVVVDATYTVSVWMRRRTGTGTVGIRAIENTISVVTIDSTWKRYSATAVATTTTGRCGVQVGTSGDEIDIWGFQMETGSVATSYIPTVSSNVVRAADAVSITGAGFSSWWNPLEGTFVLEAEMYPVNSAFFRYPISVNGSSNTTTDLIAFNNPANGNAVRFAVNQGGVGQAAISQNVTLNAVFKAAGGYKANACAVAFNGAAAAEDTSVILPTGLNRLYFNSNADTGAPGAASMEIRRLTYYNTRLPNNQLQALSKP